MVNGTFVTLMPAAVGVVISPAPIIELIRVLFSRRRTVNAITFIVTLWVATAALIVIGGLGGQTAHSGTSEPSTLVGWVFAALGLLLLVIGVLNWRNRTRTRKATCPSRRTLDRYDAASNATPAIINRATGSGVCGSALALR